MQETPLLVVQMVTYNHEPFIRKAIESVLSQQTSFPFRLIVREDCSTDKTGTICSELQNKFPEKIDLCRNQTNLGAKENGRSSHVACAGSGAKYVAYLEGDDFWTDPLKLQKQVDFLESNPDYSLCFHRVFELAKDIQRLSSLVPPGEKEEYDILDLAQGNFIHTPSVVMRNVCAEFLNAYTDAPAGDYTTCMLAARKGKIRYFPAPMAVYRIHEGGSWSSQPRRDLLKRWNQQMNLLLEGNFDQKVKEVLKAQKRKYNIEYLMLLVNEDKERFLSEIDTMMQEDAGLAGQLLKGPLVNELWNLKNSRSYKIARQLGRIRNLFTTG